MSLIITNQLLYRHQDCLPWAELSSPRLLWWAYPDDRSHTVEKKILIISTGRK